MNAFDSGIRSEHNRLDYLYLNLDIYTVDREIFAVKKFLPVA